MQLPTHHETKEEAPSLWDCLGFRYVRNECNWISSRKTAWSDDETKGKISITRKNVLEFLGLGRVDMDYNDLPI